jgi:hypothetical protein
LFCSYFLMISSYICCCPSRLIFSKKNISLNVHISQVHSCYIILGYDKFCLILLHFSFDILKLLAICSQLVIQTFSKLHGELFGKKCQSASDRLHSVLLRSLLQSLHTSSGHLDSFYAHFTNQRTERSVACNIFGVSVREW